MIGRGSEVTTLDPQRSVDFPVLINIFDTLISRDSSLSLKPGLALSWQAVDSTTWEFVLRRGVRFHNGEPFNAQAVKFSFERYRGASAKELKGKEPKESSRRTPDTYQVCNRRQ